MEVGFSDFIDLLFSWGWVVLPVLLFLVWKNLWMDYVRLKYSLSLKWLVLEIKIPQVVEKTPKVMEHIFTGLYAMRSKATIKEKYIDGKHQPEISFEVASINGSIHLFIRTPSQFKNLITSQFLAYYSDANFVEVDDYTFNLPADIPNEDYDMWGTELIFTKEDAYPIKTYKNFKEDIQLSIEAKAQFIDPMSSLMEALAQMNEGEQIWIHYMIRPAGDAWQKKGKDLIDRILGKKKKKPADNVVEEVFMFFYDMVWYLFGKVPEDKKKQEEGLEKEKKLTPGEIELVKILEESISKHGFHTNIRILYIGRRDVFSRANIPAILGTFNQFSSASLNGFMPNFKVSPGIDYFFAKTRNYLRKRKLYRNARKKLFSSKGIILNVEELATIYHIPSIIVEAPSLSKIQTKKVQPPSDLPVV